LILLLIGLVMSIALKQFARKAEAAS